MKIVKQGYELIYPRSVEDFIDEAKKIERVGRVCYKSEDKITDDSWKKFVKMINSRNHGAMIEHSTMTVLFTTDRGVSHELVRHRLASFAQESTRYCNYSKDKFNNEIIVIEPPVDSTASQVDWKLAIEAAEKTYFFLLAQGESPQIARSVLPNSLKTEIVVTANWREWQHIFRLRAISKAAHPQIRSLILPLYGQCRQVMPEVFDLGDAE